MFRKEGRKTLVSFSYRLDTGYEERPFFLTEDNHSGYHRERTESLLAEAPQIKIAATHRRRFVWVSADQVCCKSMRSWKYANKNIFCYGLEHRPGS